MINKPERMPFSRDCSSALHLLEHIQQTINNTADAQLQAQTADDINMLISVFSNPILRSIVTVEDSLSELNQQLQQHPSILPVDLYVSPSGELSLNVVPPDEIYDPHYDSKYIQRQEFDDQRVPVAKLSNSSSTDTSTSPQLGTPRSANGTMPPITTQTYAIEFQKAIEESSRGRDIINVQLYKPEGSSLGFSVVGLRSEEKGELGIYVQEIQNTGIAGRDGNLREGDQILAIDGQPLDSNISHQQAISILQKARGLVELVVARGVEEEAPQTPSPVARSPSAVSDTSKAGSDMVLNTEWAQVEVIDLVNDGSGLGFGIIGGRSTGVVVKTILPGGVADRDGRLQSGDHILQIGDVNLRGMGSEQVAAVLRQSGSHVRLVVARPVEPTSPDYQALGSHAPIVPTKILGDPEELDRHLLQNGYTETFSRQTPILETYSDHFVFRENESDVELHPQATLVMDAVRNPVGTTAIPLLSTPSLPVLTMDMLSLETSALPEMEKFTVELKKDLHGLGITIAGYVCEKEELSGIFVKSISEGSAADLCKKIQVNDRIVEVDGRSLQGYTNHQAVEVLRSTGQTVRLCLERYLRGPKFEQLQQAIAASELKPTTPSSPSAASLPRFPVSTDGESTVEIEMEGESHTTADSIVLENLESSNVDVELQDLELLIDDDYKGTLKPTVEAAIKAKWSKIIGNDCEIIVAQLCKLSEGGGLGISLEGTVDVEHGQEVRPHHYIRSILPEGPVGRNGRLQSGDELLEVNGHRLLGMNHIEVVSILKDLPMSVRMVCSRRNGDTLPHRLINSSQDRAAFARSILGGSLQNLIPATVRLVKAKSDGSLASTTTTATATDASSSKMKSRSLEPLTGLAMWSSEPQIIELVKGERGLGFSILDYQDPMNPNETVIVIRSLVPGGVAQMDGQLIPGDRLLFVNDTNLENASLDHAVQVLKGAPKGIVRIGVAKPLPIPDSISHSQDALDDISQNTPTLDDRSMFSSCESLSQSPKKEERSEAVIEGSEDVPKHPGKRHARKSSEREEGQSDDDRLDSEELLEKQFSTDGELEKSTDEDALSSDLLQLMVPVATERTMYQRTPSTGDITDDDLDEEDFPSGWAADIIHLPPSIEVEIRVHKGTEPLGISIDSVDKGVNGMLVMLVVPGGAVARDGHIHPGDYLISVNHETLRRVTNSQARAILRRAQLLSTDISVTYIPGEAAAAYRRSIQQEPQTPPLTKVVRTSPRSPYIPSDSSVESSEERDRETGQQPSRSLKGSPVISRSPHLTPADSVTKQSSVESTKSAEEAFPASQIPSPLNEEEFPKSQIPSPLDVDDIFKDVESSAAQLKPREAAAEPEAPRPAKEAEGKRGPLSVCVVDGLYSVHSPKGNKVLVGVELSPKDAKDRKPVPSGSPKKKREEKIKTLPAVREHVKVLKKSNLSFDVQDTQKEREDVKAVRSFTVEETVPEADSPSKISARTNVNVVSVTKKSDKSEKAQTKQTDRTRQGDGDKAQAGPPQQTEVRRPKERTVPRVPSFECTCEETVEKTSPECTCFSSPEVTEVPTSSQSKKSEVKKVLSPPSESSSYHTNQEVTVNQELLNTESIFSSEEEFKSGATSPFYSPRGDSPEMTIVKQANKMDKEVTANILLAKHWGPERTVEVVREPNCSLGISIVGGKVDLYNAGPDSNSAILGIFIKNVLPNSPAGRLGELKTGDRILEVDSIDLRSASHERAVEVIRSAGNKVRFLVQSLIQWSVEGEPETASLPSVVAKETTRVEESLPTEPESAAAEVESEVAQKSSDEPKAEQEEAEKQVPPPPVKEPEREAPAKKAEEPEEKKVEPKKESSKESDEEEEEDDDYEYRDLEGKMYTAKGEEIYRASAGNVKRTKEEIAADPEEEDQFGYTTNKAKKKYANLGDSVQIVHLEKSHRGLGISLAGHKDRNRMAVFVCGLNPNGTAYKTGGIQVGDEILEVNGIVLQGRCHLNASAIIKGIPGPTFKVIILRRSSALEELAVKPITQFPVSLDDEAPEQKYTKFKGLRTVTIKKGNQNLGIMIIEGKHTEVGQGIFISDIQEGSAAEQAGLLVGDMILAVNKDTLLGSNYDAAASLLKKTEGVVTLVVCNPNKAREDEREAAAAAAAGNSLDAKGQQPSSRSPTPTPSKQEQDKPSIISIPNLKSVKSSPAKQISETANSGTTTHVLPAPDNSSLTALNPHLPATALTPTASPSLSLRKSSSGKIAEEPPPDPTVCPIVPGKEVTIEILKDKIGLGLGIAGGCDTPLGVVLVHEIYPGGAAAKDGRLQPGDQILEFNSEDFRKVTHLKALETTWLTLTKVKMVVYRDESINQNDLLEVIDVELNRKPGKGLGLSVTASSKGRGVFISEIVHGGVAEADGRLMKGDYILEINGENLRECDVRTAAVAMKICSGRISIKIGRIKCKKYQSAANGKAPSGEGMLHCRTVSLEKGADGLGFSIVGGHGSPQGNLPIYIKTVFGNCAAASGDRVKCGDRILAVNGISLDGLKHEDVVDVLKKCSGTVRLTILS